MESLEKKIQKAANLYKLKKFSEAEIISKKLISNHPKIPFLYNLLGLIMMEKQDYKEAMNCYNQCIKIQPNNAIVYNNLGTLHKTKNEYTKAENYYKKSIELDKKIIEPQNNLGSLYIDQTKYEDAVICFKKCINIEPKSPISHYNLGIAYISIGKIKDAKKHLEESINIFPQFYKAHRAISRIKKYSKKDDHIHVLEELLKNSNLANMDKIELSFALGKAYDDIKNFDKAFSSYEIGNKLRNEDINFTSKHEINEFELIKDFFSHYNYKKYKDKSLSDKTPIFILGMPRSGTTLIEQIISSHPNVYGGGELHFLDQIIKKSFYVKGFLSKEKLNSTNEDILSKISKEYLYKLKGLSNKEKITDKLPINFKWIGFIKLMFPNATIIHCERNSKDTCVSIYKNYFTNSDLNYAYNLDNLVLFYNLYLNLMNFWKDSFPKVIKNTKYEKLIDNPKIEIKKIINYCNLDWNEKCLEFYNNNRPINTASDIQARSKIYKSSINSWKKYDKFIAKHFLNLKN